MDEEIKLIAIQVRLTKAEAAEVRRRAKDEDRSSASWLARLVRREISDKSGETT